MLVTLFLQERLETRRGVGLLLQSKIVKTGKEVVHCRRRKTRVDDAGKPSQTQNTWKVSERAIILAGKRWGKGTNDEENQEHI
jgi:homospermidine synthase